MRKLSLAALSLVAMPFAVLAQETGGVYLGPVVDIGLEFGGEEIASLQFTNGDTAEIHSGDGIHFAVGGHLRPHRKSVFDLRATVGYKVWNATASNADLSLDRLTLELTPSLRFAQDWWIGAGIVHHSNIQFHGDLGLPDFEFKPATGPRVELGWHFRGGRVFDAGVSAAATFLKYELDGYGGEEVDANSFGVRFTANFGWSTGREEVKPGPTRFDPWEKPSAAARTAGEPATTPVAPPTSDPWGKTSANPGEAGPKADRAETKGRARPGAMLMAGPTNGGQVRQALVGGETIFLISHLHNEAGDWWFVETERGAAGWLRQDDLAR